MASNYPPGVSGSEPQITGIWPPEQLVSHATEIVQKMKDDLDELGSLLDDQGALDKELNKSFNETGAKFTDILEGIEALLPPDYDS